MQQEKPKTQLGWREDVAVSMQDSLMASWSLGGGGHSSWKISHLECPGCVFFLFPFFFFFPSSGLLSHFNKGNGKDSR